MNREKLLSCPVEHVDITTIDAIPIIDAYRKMSFTAREVACAADIFCAMIEDPDCSVWLTIAGSTGAAGCLWIYADLVNYNMVDVVVATGASIIDMDFFEALGFRHYQGMPNIDDAKLRELRIDRIYDTFIDEDELQMCDETIFEIAELLQPRPYSSREFISAMGKYLVDNPHKEKRGDSLVRRAYYWGVPIFCPAFSDSSAGFGLVKHQEKNPKNYVSIDSVKDFRELTYCKLMNKETGLFMIGGGVPKNFAQDTVVCAEVALKKESTMHKYAVQITVADVRDGACSSSTLSEAQSWGKVDSGRTQMVYAEAGLVLPIIAAYAYQKGNWRKRERRKHAQKL